MADQQQAFREMCETLGKRQAAKYRSRHSHNEGIRRASIGGQARIGDYVLVKEVATTLSGEGVHSKFSHEHCAGPWQVVRILHPGLSYAMHLNGRSIRKKVVSAADTKPLHERPVELRHAFEDDFAHLAWGPGIGLARGHSRV